MMGGGGQRRPEDTKYKGSKQRSMVAEGRKAAANIAIEKYKFAMYRQNLYHKIFSMSSFLNMVSNISIKWLSVYT
jgi:hypothetical protein